MPWYEDSSVFFDGVIDEEATVGETTVRAIKSDTVEVSSGGSNISSTIGHHVSVLVRKSELADKPAIGSRITIGSETFTVRNAMDSGSCWKMTATANQRKR